MRAIVSLLLMFCPVLNGQQWTVFRSRVKLQCLGNPLRKKTPLTPLHQVQPKRSICNAYYKDFH